MGGSPVRRRIPRPHHAPRPFPGSLENRRIPIREGDFQGRSRHRADCREVQFDWLIRLKFILIGVHPLCLNNFLLVSELVTMVRMNHRRKQPLAEQGYRRLVVDGLDRHIFTLGGRHTAASGTASAYRDPSGFRLCRQGRGRSSRLRFRNGAVFRHEGKHAGT